MARTGPERSPKRVSAAALVLAVLVFGVDLRIPLGVAGGVPYVAVVLLSLWSPDTRLPVRVAIGCSILTGLGFVLSPAGGIMWMVFANRFLALFAIWVTAILGVRWRSAQMEMAREQQRLAQVSRVNSMGELASGIAHELNQPLSAILNYAEASSMAVQTGKLDPKQILKDLGYISDAAERGGAIVHRLRSFVADRSIERSPQDINKLLTDAISLLAHDIELAGIKMRMELAHSLPRVLADPIQIQQVAVNLIRNAIEAMENSDAKQLVIRSSLHESKEVDVSVCDSGCGLGKVPTETIFEHFFTTKQRGMGMGLSICRSIIEQHGGRLWADRSPGGGAVFTFTLPAESVVTKRASSTFSSSNSA